MQNVSFKVELRNDFVLKNNKSPLFIRLYISSKDKRFKIPSIQIDAKNWDASRNMVKKSEPNFMQINRIISEYAKKTQNIIYDYALKQKDLSFELFEKELYSQNSGSISFFSFAEEIINNKYTNTNTQKTVTEQLNKLKEFKPELILEDIDYDFLVKYKYYLETVKLNKPSTVEKGIKTIKMFLNEAINRELIQKNPAAKIKVSMPESEKKLLSKQEILQLITYYQEKELSPTKKEVLRCFLFSCFTGIRYGDFNIICYKHIVDGNRLHFTETKTKHIKRQKLPEFAQSLINFYNISENQKVFRLSANQVCNRYLKEIATEVGIKQDITFHYAKRIFASFLLNATGDIYTASKLAGHKGVDTTIKHYADSFAETEDKAIDSLQKHFFGK